MKKFALIVPFLLIGCTSADFGAPVSSPAPVAAATTPSDCNPGLAIVNASLWVQSAAEYEAAALATYNNARRAVEAGLAQGGEKPPAIITDVDETVLENMAFEARMIRAGKTFDSAAWTSWVNEAVARPVPGALEFIRWANSRGVTTFYVTNRKTEEEAGTRENLRRVGFPIVDTEDTVLVRGERPEWEPRDKAPRRNWVAERYRVLAVLGDDLNDFVNAHAQSVEERDALVRTNAPLWGTRWFILPNPIYGSWEDVMTGEGTPCQKLERKIQALEP